MLWGFSSNFAQISTVTQWWMVYIFEVSASHYSIMCATFVNASETWWPRSSHCDPASTIQYLCYFCQIWQQTLGLRINWFHFWGQRSLQCYVLWFYMILWFLACVKGVSGKITLFLSAQTGCCVSNSNFLLICTLPLI